MKYKKITVSAARVERGLTKVPFNGRKGKYNAQGEHVDGYWFASASEAKRYRQLKVMLDAGIIDALEMQPKYAIAINGRPITTYRGDFRYAVLDERKRIERVVVEDVKGMVTDVYALKKKMVEALYEIQIREIPAKEIDKWEQKVG